MHYKASCSSFYQTFKMKCDGTSFRHNSGVKFKLFPFTTRDNGSVIEGLDSIVGKYLSKIGQTVPKSITFDELFENLKDETDIEVGQTALFEHIIRNMFFDSNGVLVPLNLKLMMHAPCNEINAIKFADYLVDVLGDEQFLKDCLAKALIEQEKQSNALEQFVVSLLTSSDAPKEGYTPYRRIVGALTASFNVDFEYILKSRNRTRNDLIPLLEFYSFSYTAQTCLQLDRFVYGERNTCRPLYFCLDWEKTSQNRKC